MVFGRRITDTGVIVIILLAKTFCWPQFLKDGHHHQSNQDTHDEVFRLANCNLSQKYSNLHDFTFNPRSVTIEDSECLTLQMFKDLDFIQQFDISMEKLSRFILRVKNGYRNNPYHNWIHGFGFLQFSFAVLKNCKLIEKNYFTPLEGMAFLTAGLSHDVDHPGTNNMFQLKTHSLLAQEYEQLGSILERHHLEVTKEFLKSPESNFVENLGDMHEEFMRIISQVILATDLKIHFEVLSKEEEMVNEGYDPNNSKHHELLRSIIATCADLNDQTKDWVTARDVTKLIYTEFFNQGDQEKELGFIPDLIMDRCQANIPLLQISFLNETVIPTYKFLQKECPAMDTLLNILQHNLISWKKSTAYIEEETRKGRNQMDILSDTELDNIFS